MAGNGLPVKNTFIDCPSPWHLDTQEMPRKSNSDPGSSSQYSSSAASSEIGTSGSEAEGPSRAEQMRRVLEAKSVGSTRPGDQGHAEGSCRPCKYWVKKAGCQGGDGCEFCHLIHNAGHPGTKWRPCRAKRKRYNRLLQRLEKQAEESGQGFDFGTVELPPSIEGNAFLRDKVKRKLQASSRKPGEGTPGGSLRGTPVSAKASPIAARAPPAPPLPSQPPPPQQPSQAVRVASTDRGQQLRQRFEEPAVVLDPHAPLEFGQVYRL